MECCKNIVYGNRRVVYCSVCGQKFNKEFEGKSLWDYAKHKGDAIWEKYNNSGIGKLYFKKVNKTSVEYSCYTVKNGVGVLDGDGGTLHFFKKIIHIKNEKHKVLFLHKLFNTEYDTTKIHLSDEFIFDKSIKTFNERILNELKPVGSIQINEEEYGLFESTLMDITNNISNLFKG